MFHQLAGGSLHPSGPRCKEAAERVLVKELTCLETVTEGKVEALSHNNPQPSYSWLRVATADASSH